MWEWQEPQSRLLRGAAAGAGNQDKGWERESTIKAIFHLPTPHRVFFQLSATCPPTPLGPQRGLEPDTWRDIYPTRLFTWGVGEKIIRSKEKRVFLWESGFRANRWENSQELLTTQVILLMTDWEFPRAKRESVWGWEEWENASDKGLYGTVA